MTSLLPHNTFHINTRAREVVLFRSVEELCEVLRKHAQERIIVVGEGSNMLFVNNIDAIVLRSDMHRARALKETQDAVWIEAEAGLHLDDLIAQTVDMGLMGLENLSYIPGTVGASAVQNVGAYGVEAKDVIEEVHAVDRMTLEQVVLSNVECRFAYRQSRFKQDWTDRYIITSVVYRLQKDGKVNTAYGGLGVYLKHIPEGAQTAQDVREAVIRLRKEKLPEVEEYGSAGSFFMNPVVDADKAATLLQRYPDMPHFAVADGVKIPAAWLIDKSGCKGMKRGGAAVWEKQPLVLVNLGDATADDVTGLAEEVVNRVQQQMGIWLRPEVIYVR